MTPELYAISTTLLYAVGLVLVQKRHPFLPLLPLQVVLNPYYTISTIFRGWEGASAKILLLAGMSVCVLIALLPRLVGIRDIRTSWLLSLFSFVLLIFYSVLLGHVNGNHPAYMLIDIIPMVEFIFFFVITYAFMKTSREPEKMPRNIFYNLLLVCVFSAVVSLVLVLLFPEMVLFGFMVGGDVVMKITDFFGPLAALLAFGLVFGAGRATRRPFRLLMLLVFAAGLVISLVSMYRSIWLAVIIGITFVALASGWRLLLVEAVMAIVVAALGFFLLTGYHGILEDRVAGQSFMENPRVQQARVLVDDLAGRPWGAGAGATIYFDDQTDATAEGKGVYYVGQRPYRGNYYLSWLFYAGPVFLLPLGILAVLFVMHAGRLRRLSRDRSAMAGYAVPVGGAVVYFCVLLLSFPAVLNYPILGTLGLLFGFIASVNMG